jgi:choline dehydrogenase-like flavoprotein
MATQLLGAGVDPKVAAVDTNATVLAIAERAASILTGTQSRWSGGHEDAAAG